jgi:hypothetical protein
MRLFKVAAGKPILERPAEIFSSIFFPALLVEEDPGAPPGIISVTSGHLGRTTDLP